MDSFIHSYSHMRVGLSSSHSPTASKYFLFKHIVYNLLSFLNLIIIEPCFPFLASAPLLRRNAAANIDGIMSLGWRR